MVTIVIILVVTTVTMVTMVTLVTIVFRPDDLAGVVFNPDAISRVNHRVGMPAWCPSDKTPWCAFMGSLIRFT